MRVISGDYRGRKLKSLSGDNTRPTTDKVKESIFNIIGPYFDEDLVLDLYSGSGALAIEAVSRGAKSAVCVEKNYQAMQIIKTNIAITKEPEKFQLLKMPAEKAILQLYNQKKAPFSLVFLDPPYAKQTIEKDIRELINRELISSGAQIVCEVDSTVELPDKIEQVLLIKTPQYGSTKVGIYRWE